MAAILGILSSLLGGSIAHIDHIHHHLNLPDMTQQELNSHANEEIKKYNSHYTEEDDREIRHEPKNRVHGGDYSISGGAYKIEGGNWFRDHTPFGGNGNVEEGGDYVINGGGYSIKGGGNQRKMTMADLTK